MSGLSEPLSLFKSALARAGWRTLRKGQRLLRFGLRFREGHRLQPCRNWELFFFSALAAEVRFSFQNERETSGAKAQNKKSCAVTARLKSCPSLNLVPFLKPRASPQKHSRGMWGMCTFSTIA